MVSRIRCRPARRRSGGRGRKPPLLQYGSFGGPSPHTHTPLCVCPASPPNNPYKHLSNSRRARLGGSARGPPASRCRARLFGKKPLGVVTDACCHGGFALDLIHYTSLHTARHGVPGNAAGGTPPSHYRRSSVAARALLKYIIEFVDAVQLSRAKPSLPHAPTSSELVG